MNVDGPTANGSPVPGVPRPNQRETRETSASKPQTEGAAKAAAPSQAERAGRSASVPHDTYEHVTSDSPGSVTYGESPPAEGRVLNNTFDGLQETVKQSYSAEIVDLDTAVNAKGLPLQSAEENSGVLKQDILRAYRKGDEDSGGNSPKTASDILDTLG